MQGSVQDAGLLQLRPAASTGFDQAMKTGKPIAGLVSAGTALLLLATGCSSGQSTDASTAAPPPSTTQPDSDQQSLPPEPSTQPTDFAFETVKIGQTFAIAPRVKCRIDRARYGPRTTPKQRLDFKVWNENNSGEDYDGCLFEKFTATDGEKFGLMNCRSNQFAAKGLSTEYLHRCKFPKGTVISQVQISSLNFGKRVTLQL